MATETVTVEEKFAELLRKELEAKFHDEFVFEPIYVQADFDLDGNRCLDAYIVFDGDQKKLDPSWTAALPRLLWSRSENLGYPGLPTQWFVSKSDWLKHKEGIPWTPLTCF